MGSDLVRMPPILIEACVETLPHALAAEAGGAGRLELCSALGVGGLTPDAALVAACTQRMAIPVVTMVRSRPGSFVLQPGELVELTREVQRMRTLGAAGVVLGALTPEGTVDVPAVAALVAAASGLPVTFHRAFDEIQDQAAALEQLIALGVARVLTSGGARTASEGAGRIAELVRQAAGRIVVLAGGSIRAPNAEALVARTGVSELHSRTFADVEAVRAFVRAANAG
jgi:copper homeostasis protein